jgi:hypothetical protein
MTVGLVYREIGRMQGESSRLDRFRRLGELLSTIGRRRGRGTPTESGQDRPDQAAPPRDTFSTMPEDVHHLIREHLGPGNLNDLRQTSRFFQRSVEATSASNWEITRRLAGRLHSTAGLYEDEQCEVLAEVGEDVRHLSARLQRELVTKTLALRNENERCKAMAGIGRGGLGHLDPDLQARLVRAALALQFDVNRATAVSSIAQGGLGGLSRDVRTGLAEGALGLAEDNYRYRAIRGIGEGGLGYLTPDLQHRVVDAALGLPETLRASAIAGIGRGSLWGVPTAEQDRLVAGAMNLQNQLDRREGIEGLGQGGLRYMDGHLQAALVEGALALPEQYSSRRVAIAAIGRGGLEGVREDVQASLIAGVVSLPGAQRARAIEGIGQGGLRYLREDLQGRLVSSASELRQKGRHCPCGHRRRWSPPRTERRDSDACPRTPARAEACRGLCAHW